mmetsp:Transcript_18735/g.26693  ORF Transcript_18735/g.26693 Transcript_18735/m.26693 type:complete len:334 (+) Transcript_18735:212-1213(+)
MVSVVNNDSDPAASSTSDDSDSDSSSESTASTDESPTADRGGGGGTAAQDDEELLLKIQNLRSIIDPDGVMPLEELLDILDENERASAGTTTTTARATTSSAPSERTSARTAGTSSSPSGGSNRWDRCQAPSSRPGVMSVGGAITGRVVPVGELDEIELIEKKINAVHKVQARLQYSDLQSKTREVERMYEEEKRMLEAATMGQTEQKPGPRLKTWDPPSDEMLRIEPTLPPPEPLPSSFIEEGMDSGVTNSQIAVGKFFDPGEDEEEKQEEDVSIANKYSEVTLDDSELGAYEHVVRCWKCRAGLKINIEIGLVACPRCRSISPTTDVTNVG